MKENHEKTGLAAFILALLGAFTFGITVIPALICALISKRQSEAEGKPTDGFTTASMVVSGFLLFSGCILVFGFGAMFLESQANGPQISMNTIRALLIGTGTGIIAISLLMWYGGRSRRVEQRNRLMHLSGRGLAPRRGTGRRRVSARGRQW
jgi:predicted benzoate:H+ symporter BenE